MAKSKTRRQKEKALDALENEVSGVITEIKNQVQKPSPEEP
jgi:hypothetical protein